MLNSVDAKSSTTWGIRGKHVLSNSLSHGNSSDSNLKDNWRFRMDPSRQEKIEEGLLLMLKAAAVGREEERDTGLLGRKDRRKEDHRAEFCFS
ncbi:hypothetical protein NC652_004858 [Populus alba x Populus x berolinensis]|nr:hypothetical protein NC652_004858 [Populus alba x Populus x berolinensis]